jgi:CheY-like chemotaxis protein
MEGAEKQNITVDVAPADSGRFVVVRIADTGPGIPEEEMDKIWAAFYTTKGVRHAGLGLSATAQILKQIDGQAAASNAPGGGAVFELLIPIFDGLLPAGRLPADKSVLLIDDDDAWGRFAQAVLTEAGSRVIRSADGQVDPGLFDLVLVDDVLEASDSLAVLKAIKAKGAGAKTLVVASSLRVERTMELMPYDVRDVLLKPYTAAALAEIVV